MELVVPGIIARTIQIFMDFFRSNTALSLIARATLLVSAICCITQTAMAQTEAPPVLFWVEKQTSNESGLATSSWNITNNYTDPQGAEVRREESGSVSDGSATITVLASIIGESNNTAGSASQTVTVWVRGTASTTFQANATGSATAYCGGTASPAEASVYSRYSNVDYEGAVAHKPVGVDYGPFTDTLSHSKYRFVNIGCGGQNSSDSTTFPEYPGVVYHRPSGIGQITISAHASYWGNPNADLELVGSATQSISVQVGEDAPVALLSGPEVNGQATDPVPVGASVKFHNLSYDPDNQNGSTPLEGICATQWTVLRPDNTTSTGSGAAFTFIPTLWGQYTVTLLVTDDEGEQSQTSSTFFANPRIPMPGDDGPYVPYSCGEGGTDGGVSPTSGNARAWWRDPVSTRGYPLTCNIHVNSQTRFPTRTTAFGNASFTYGIEVHEATVGNELRQFVIDADGQELDFGPASSAPAATPGIFSTLSVNGGGGYELTNAGPPESIDKAGNFAYEFSGAGRLLKLTDPSGNVQELYYNSNGDLIEVEDVSSGRKLEFQYDVPGRVARIVEGGGEAVTHLEYSNGRVSAIALKDSTNAVLRELTLGYNQDGLLSQLVRDGNANKAVNFTYVTDGQGIPLANFHYTTPGDGSRLDYFVPVSTGAAYRTARTTAEGGEVLFDLNRYGDLLKITYPAFNGSTAQPTRTYTYDSWRSLTSFSNGATTYTYTNSALGLPTSIVDNAGNSWSYTYNGVDLLTASDSSGTSLTLAYGDPQNPHSPTDITDGAGRTWTRSYNQYGQLVSITPPTGSPMGSLEFTYEENPLSPSFGYLKEKENGAGDTVQYSSYSPLGDVLSVSTNPAPSVVNTTNYLYDANRRLLEVTHPDNNSYTYTYQGDELALVEDEAGNQTSFSWCEDCGLLNGIAEPLGRALSWLRDGDHKITEFVDARTKSTLYSFGLAGELKRIDYPDGAVIERQYDNYGRLKRIKTPRNRNHDFTYNSAGRLSKEYLNSTVAGITYTYLPDGRLSTVADEAGTTTFTYTAARQLETVTYDYSKTSLTPLQKLTYTYNPDGSVSTLTWENGSTVVASWSYSYDLAGRLSSVSNSFGESVSYSYDGEGKIASQTNGNGTVTSYSYNQARGWPTVIEHSLSGTPFASYALEYDDGLNTVGNLTEVTELDGSIVSYQYDDLYGLVSETRTGTNPYANTFGYDLAGNVTSLNGTAFATYNDANEIATLTGGSVSHDASGNIILVSGAGLPSSTLNWDTREKMLHQTANNTQYRYVYEWSGKRVLRKASSSVSGFRWYIYDGGRVIGEVGTGGAAVAYTWGADGLAATRWITNNASYYYHFGPQGETRHLTDGTGAIQNTYLYNAYGDTLTTTGSAYNRHRYGGKVGYFTDGPMNVLLATYRWYSPELMRWISRDPIDYKGGDNLYQYVMGNPVYWLDPDGLQPRIPDEDRFTPARCERVALLCGEGVTQGFSGFCGYAKEVCKRHAVRRRISPTPTYCPDEPDLPHPFFATPTASPTVTPTWTPDALYDPDGLGDIEEILDR